MNEIIGVFVVIAAAVGLTDGILICELTHSSFNPLFYISCLLFWLLITN